MPAAEYQSMVQRSPSSNDVLADSPKAFLRLAHIELALPLGWVVSLRMRPSQPAHRLKQGFAATLDASSPLIGGIEAAQLRWTRHAAEGFLYGVERADILNRCALRQQLQSIQLRTSATLRLCVENTLCKQPLNAMPLAYNGDVHPVCEQP